MAVFGKKWGGELRVPKKDGSGFYWMDWILALLDEQGRLAEFVAVEVQSIDTTGRYGEGRDALRSPQRRIVPTTAGFNWENVNKRILPQLIYKGQLLQRERFCKKGLYFVCPQPVYENILNRIGGEAALPEFANLQPASISFYVYDHDLEDVKDGVPVSLRLAGKRHTIIESLQRAFNSVTLTNPDVYRDAILEGLGLDRTPSSYLNP